MISRQKLLNIIIVLYLLFPIAISFVLKILNILVPTYLFIFLLIIIILFFTSFKPHFFFFKKPEVLLLLFLSWLLISGTYSPSIIAKEKKNILIYYDIIVPLILFYMFNFLNNFDFRIKSIETSLLKSTYFLIWTLSLFFLIAKQHDESGRYFLPGSENSILFSRNISAYIIILLTIKHRCSSLLRYSTLLLSVILLFASASKGPLVALLVVLYFHFLYNNTNNKIKINLFFFILLILIFSLLFMIDKNNYIFDTNFYSIFARQEYFKVAFENLDFNIFKGIGLGSFSIYFLGEDVISYPHNIFLEIFLECGLIGLILFLALLWKFYKNFSLNIFSLLAIFYFISAQFSGDLPGNNNFFILYFLYFTFFIKNKQKHILVET